MAVMDEFKEEREALKRGTPKQKLAYFWYYYKWHVIISVIIIGMLVSFIYQFVNRKDTAFNAVLLNASLLDQMSSEQPDFLTDFAEKEGIDLNTSDITFDTSIRIVEDSMDEVSVTSTQKLMAYVAANELDSMITDFDSFQKYANSSLFYDPVSYTHLDVYKRQVHESLTDHYSLNTLRGATLLSTFTSSSLGLKMIFSPPS